MAQKSKSFEFEKNYDIFVSSVFAATSNNTHETDIILDYEYLSISIKSKKIEIQPENERKSDFSWGFGHFSIKRIIYLILRTV